jgi:uncharacterized protein (TIGR04255 family)
MKIRRAMFEMRFNPSLSFFDKMNLIGDALAKDYSEWKTDRVSIGLSDREKKIKILIESGRVAFDSDDFSSAESFFTRIRKGLNTYLQNVIIGDIKRTGIRFKYIIKVDFSFEELVEIMSEKIYNNKLGLLSDNSYEDLALVINFKKKDFKIHLISGPLKKDEIISRLQPAFIEQYDKTLEPDTSIFIDIDCFQENKNLKDIDNFVREGYNISSSIADDFVKYMLEAKL